MEGTAEKENTPPGKIEKMLWRAPENRGLLDLIFRSCRWYPDDPMAERIKYLVATDEYISALIRHTEEGWTEENFQKKVEEKITKVRRRMATREASGLPLQSLPSIVFHPPLPMSYYDELKSEGRTGIRLPIPIPTPRRVLMQDDKTPFIPNNNNNKSNINRNDPPPLHRLNFHNKRASTPSCSFEVIDCDALPQRVKHKKVEEYAYEEPLESPPTPDLEGFEEVEASRYIPPAYESPQSKEYDWGLLKEKGVLFHNLPHRDILLTLQEAEDIVCGNPCEGWKAGLGRTYKNISTGQELSHKDIHDLERAIKDIEAKLVKEGKFFSPSQNDK